MGVVLDEGLASPDAHYRAFYAERSPWWLVIKAVGAPGHGSKLYDNSAMENLLKSIEAIRRFRASQFDLIKAGFKAEGEVVSVNMVFLKAGTPSPTVSPPLPFLLLIHYSTTKMFPQHLTVFSLTIIIMVVFYLPFALAGFCHEFAAV